MNQLFGPQVRGGKAAAQVKGHLIWIQPNSGVIVEAPED